MTSGRLLARNTALSLFAQLSPLVIAVMAVPILISSLGEARFGVLTLAWALIGYFGLFDFGIGRALTQAASEALGRNDQEQLVEVSAAALGAMYTLGAIGGLLLLAVTPWLSYDMLKMDAALRPEAARSFQLLALSLPFVLATLGLRGLFEAHQHFGIATALKLPYALFNFVGPLLILPFTNNLAAIVGVLVFGRIVTWGAHMYFGFRRYPWLRVTFRKPGTIAPLLRLGGWMTVSNIISPLMVNLDRFLIGAIISMSAVAFYVTPYEVVTKVLFIPAAILAVFFPAFAAAFVQDRTRTVVILDRAIRLMLIAMFPPLLLTVAFAHEGLQWWVGAAFARQSTVILQVLAIGVFLNALAQAPFSFLQATGRPDLTAKLHLVELPVYAVMIFAFARLLGLPGVALAWTGRIAIDTLALLWLARARVPEASHALGRSAAWTILLAIAMVVLSLIPGVAARVVGTAAVIAAFALIAWLQLLAPEERRVISSAVRVTLGRLASAT